MSNLKVLVLMAGLTAVFAAVGGALGGQGGMLLALLLAAVMNFAAYFGSSAVVLRMYPARVVSEAEAPRLFGMVNRLRTRAGLPTEERVARLEAMALQPLRKAA